MGWPTPVAAGRAGHREAEEQPRRGGRCARAVGHPQVLYRGGTTRGVPCAVDNGLAAGAQRHRTMGAAIAKTGKSGVGNARGSL